MIKIKVTYMDDSVKYYYADRDCGVVSIYESLDCSGDLILINATDIHDVITTLKTMIQYVKRITVRKE